MCQLSDVFLFQLRTFVTADVSESTKPLLWMCEIFKMFMLFYYSNSMCLPEFFLKDKTLGLQSVTHSFFLDLVCCCLEHSSRVIKNIHTYVHT